uniref:Sulfatase-modifying factor enzyme-like domain-containing protein n=1 Tax=Mucochytrium quahogii TaxID=96639 RepID=A0A7S2RWC3_9STRA|mmetsp:Transcript_3265/g.4718  ORF Transcript_3265/g.4718 Transcript_3265/m.4718 type:complete len:841 (-) Transcript_3265:1134-3656(-)
MISGIRTLSARTPRPHSLALRTGIRHHSIVGRVACTQNQQHVEEWQANLSGVDEERLQGPRGNWWWTGKNPAELAGENGKLHSLPQPVVRNVNSDMVQAYFDNTWTLCEVLFSSLQGERAFYQPPYHHLRHPMIFYYGHTATFYTNKLNVAGLLDGGIDPYFENIFEVGVDEMRWDDLSKNDMLWPQVGEVHAYRKETYKAVSDVIARHVGDGKRITPDDPLWAVLMTLEHDRIHLETSSVLLREMSLDSLRKPDYWPSIHPSGKTMNAVDRPHVGVDYPLNQLVSVDASTEPVHVGKPEEFPTFGWDNEYGARKVGPAQSFEASKFMVSNGEFYEFVVDGGYRKDEHWTEEGSNWRKFRNAKWPTFWSQNGPSGKHEYRLRTIFEEIDMPWTWPVVVNKHEATAFCNWKATRDGRDGVRLLTEAEHLLIREPEQRPPLVDASLDPALVHGGDTISDQAGVSLNLAFGSESPVDYHMESSTGFCDVTGNMWEWAEDDFNPLEGFQVHPYYEDFSAPCFDGEHNMILGGSFVSTGDAGANLYCRYHFRPHFFQHAGFRYVVPSIRESFPGEGSVKKLGETSSNPASNIYETDELLNQYFALHFGQRPNVVDATVRAHPARPDELLDFPKRCANLLNNLAGNKSRVLDLGCAVGGASFELTKWFDRVTGVDFSSAFIDAAESIRNDPTHSVRFSVPVEGRIRREHISAELDPLVDASRVEFMVGDACNLGTNEELGGQFDAILMANLLCRLPDPVKCLNDLGRLLKPGGCVLLVSPFSWLNEFTVESKWLQQGSSDSKTRLDEIMAMNGFEKVYDEDMPLLIREHERKYQYIIPSATAYRKV